MTPTHGSRTPSLCVATALGLARSVVPRLTRMPAMLSTATMAHAPTTGTMPWPERWAPCLRTSQRSRLTLSSACHSVTT
eukprot:5436861-Alexandrium_andersonii.AAC.1